MAKRVLVIGDMQNDYDIDANVALYGEVRSPYANPIAALVPGPLSFGWVLEPPLLCRTALFPRLVLGCINADLCK